MSDEHRAGIPMLAGVSANGTVFPAEPILDFDRKLDESPRERLKRKLESWYWREDDIENFLDAMGFKP